MMSGGYVHLSSKLAIAGQSVTVHPLVTEEAEVPEWHWRELGQSVFTNNCAACHQMTGEGISGVFPAFKGNEFVMGDPRAVIRVPMNGRGGMPTFRDALSDDEFAAVLSYIRNSWGNEAEPIAPGLVAEVRGEQ